MKFDLRDSPITPIFETSIEAFGTELRHLMNGEKDTPTFLLKMQDGLDLVKKEQPDIKPPFFTFRLNDVSHRDDSLPISKAYKTGIQTGGPKSRVDTETGKPVDPNTVWKSQHPIPVTLTMNVEYYCSYKEQIHFSQVWLFLAVKPVRILLGYGGVDWPVDMVFDKTVTYSDIDFDKDSLVSCETTATLQTWMVQEDTRKSISRYTVKERIVGATDEADTSIRNQQRKRVSTDTEFVFDDDGRTEKP